MSWKLMERVLELGLPAAPERVLFRMAKFASDDGTRCFPGIDKLTGNGLDERSVQRALKELKKLKLIEPVAHVGGGRGRATVYHLHLYPASKGDSAVTLSDEKRVTADRTANQERVTTITEKGDNGQRGGQERVSPVAKKGDTAVTPIHQDSVIRAPVDSSGVPVHSRVASSESVNGIDHVSRNFVAAPSAAPVVDSSSRTVPRGFVQVTELPLQVQKSLSHALKQWSPTRDGTLPTYVREDWDTLNSLTRAIRSCESAECILRCTENEVDRWAMDLQSWQYHLKKDAIFSAQNSDNIPPKVPFED